MARMSPAERRETIVDAALSVARRKGLAATTVRDVAREMGTSSGLIHHYFDSMDEVLAAAFERVAGRDLAETQALLDAAPDPRAALVAFLGSYAPVGEDWAFQLWLDAWAEAGRRPAVRHVSGRLNLGWAAMLERVIRAGVARGEFRASDPAGAAWRILSLVDGLALQVVAHRTIVDRSDMLAWAALATERELGLQPGSDTPEHRDYLRVNATLESVEREIKTALLDPFIAGLDELLGRVDDWLALWNVAKARAEAWERALHMYGHPDPVYGDLHDRAVGFGSHLLLVPLLA
jgi:AcrR family transcriptional regulator